MTVAGSPARPTAPPATSAVAGTGRFRAHFQQGQDVRAAGQTLPLGQSLSPARGCPVIAPCCAPSKQTPWRKPVPAFAVACVIPMHVAVRLGAADNGQSGRRIRASLKADLATAAFRFARPMRRLSALLAASFSLLATTSPPATPIARWPTARRSQTLLLGNSSEPGDLDPQTATALTEMNVLVALFEGLTCLDKRPASRSQGWRKAGTSHPTASSTPFTFAPTPAGPTVRR